MRDRIVGAGREPALDGVRALAVLAVVAFHGEATWASGGFLGVDVFFVLSGFLITRLLLAEHHQHGRVDLAAFFVRRLRRIVPAVILLVAGLVVIGLFVESSSAQRARLPADAAAALASVANWHLLAGDEGYFAVTESPSLLEHTWSLSVEEQFYLLWAPLLALSLAGLVRLGRSTAVLVPGILVAALASAAWMGHRASDPWTLDHAYWDTAARLHGPLVGAALAVLVSLRATPDDPARPQSRMGRRTWAPSVVAGAGLLGLVVLVASTESSTPSLYPHRFALASLCAAALVAGLHLHPSGVPARVLGWRPIAALGLISYGIYLWHWPLLFLITGRATGLEGAALHGARLLVTLAAAAGSYLVVERVAQRRRDGLRVTAGVLALAGAAVVVVAVLVAQPTGDPSSELVMPGDEAYAPPVDLRRADPFVASTPSTPFSSTPFTTAAGTDPPGSPTVLPTSVPVSGEPMGPTSPTPAPAAPSASTVVPPTAGPTTVSPPASTPTVAPAPVGPPVRVAVFGDSVAQSLAIALAAHGPSHRVEVIDQSIFGCGVLRTGPFRLAGVERAESDLCLGWRSTWSASLVGSRPDLALYVLGRHEILDRYYLSGWTAIGDAGFDHYITSELQAAIDLARVLGVPVAIATTPFYAGSEAPGGGIRPENDPARVHRFNHLVHDVAARNPDVARVVDLGGLVSPGGRYASVIDGVLVRDDGVHFAPGSGAWLAPRLLPELASLGR